MRLRLLCLTLALLLGSSFAHAQKTCGGRLSASERLALVERDLPALKTFISGTVQQRVKRAGLAWEQLDAVLSRCSASACELSLATDKFIFEGSGQILTELERGKVFEIHVNYFQTVEGDAESGRKDKIKMSYSASAPNFAFLYLAATIFSAAHQVLEREPEVRTIRIVGTKVVNAELAETLRRLGFARSRVRVSERLLTYGIHALAGQAPTALAAWIGAPTALTASLMMMGAAAQVVYEIDNHPVPDWTLEIPLP